MLKLLVRKQLMEIFRSYFYDSKKNKKRSRAAIIGYLVMFAVLMVGLIGGMFTVFSNTLCAPLMQLGLGWLYFALMSLIAIMLGAFGSVFNTYAGLYLAKDNDLLLSLPIPVSAVMASRLMSVYLMGLMYSAVVIVPAVIVYWITAKAAAAAVVGSILLVLLISVIVLLLSCLLGCVVAKISLKLKHRSIVTVLLSLVFLGVYFFICFRSQTVIQDFLLNAADYGEKIRGAAYGVYLFGRVGEGDWLAVAVVTAVVAVAAALTWLLLSHSFLGIATASAKTEKRAYRSETIKTNSVSAALLRKEFARFTSSPNYMLNCGLGGVFLLAAAVIVLVKGAFIRELMTEVFSTSFTLVLFAAAVCMMASGVDAVAPSVSLEGKSLWVLQTLPLDPWLPLRAKLRMQLLLAGIPTVLCVVCAALALRTGVLGGALLAFVSLSYVVFAAHLGLTLDLKRPNLVWTNELAPIKQSMPVMVMMFGGWVYAMALGVGGYALRNALPAEAYLAIAGAVTAVGAALLRRWLRTKGAEIFRTL